MNYECIIANHGLALNATVNLLICCNQKEVNEGIGKNSSFLPRKRISKIRGFCDFSLFKHSFHDNRALVSSTCAQS